MAADFDPLFGKPPCFYEDAPCLPDCEHGYAGPCRRQIRRARAAYRAYYDWRTIDKICDD